ncbi:MAG: ribokinase [Ruminococcaceae bacterium]|nr:ribokinase [Oscillospiraceae bacterium]
MKIYNLGSLNIDYVYNVKNFVRPGETISSTNYSVFPGGKGLNQSVALSRAGANVLHGGIVGNNSEILTDTLKNSGVDISRLKHIDGASGHAIIQVDKSGQNCILLFGGANQMFDEEYIDSVLYDAEKGDLILLQNEINALDIIFEKANKLGLEIAFNPSPFKENIKALPLHYVKWWLVNEIEGQELTGENEPSKIAEAMINKYPNSNLVLTLGKNGAMFKSKQKEFIQPIFQIPVVDTTAAGDTFTGFLLAAIMDGKSEEDALLFATKASTLAVSRKGASVSIPTLSEVESFK